MTTKPNLTNFSAAFKVSIGSGNKYFGSGCISNLIQLVSKASLDNCAAKMASFTSRTPEVFGNKCMFKTIHSVFFT